MPSPKIVLAAAVTVIALVAGALLLSRTKEPAAPPAGYRTFEGEIHGHSVKFAYPQAWGEVVRDMEGLPGRKKLVTVVKALGPRGTDGTRPAVRFSALAGQTASLESLDAFSQATASLEYPNYRVVEEADADVPGAEKARARVYEYDLKNSSGGKVRSRVTSVVALTEDGVFVGLTADTHADDPQVDGAAVRDSLTLAG